MKKARGFTLMEMMVVVAIMGILAALAVFGLSRAVNAARVSGNRFSLASAVDFARSRAIAVGRDVYVVFGNVSRQELFPDANAPFVVVYDDAEQTMRAHLDDLMTEVNAHGLNVRERFVASDGSSAFFRTIYPTAVKPCAAGDVPAYMAVTRTTRQNACDPAFCTFCEDQGGSCVGAIRFAADGTARIVTGPAGSGGLIRLVNHVNDDQSACLAISEPAGITITVRD